MTLDVVKIGGVESVQEGRGEPTGEQSADDVCAWFDGAQGEG